MKLIVLLRKKKRDGNAKVLDIRQNIVGTGKTVGEKKTHIKKRKLKSLQSVKPKLSTKKLFIKNRKVELF